MGNIVIQGVINGWNGCINGAAAVKLNNPGDYGVYNLANGISNYTAQNMGAGKYTRVKERNAGRGKDCVDFVSSSVSSVFFAGEYAIRFFMN